MTKEIATHRSPVDRHVACSVLRAKKKEIPMLRVSAAVLSLSIVSFGGLACTSQSGLGIPDGSGGQAFEASGGHRGAGGVGGSHVGLGGISGAGGCIVEPPCALLNCPYGYAPSSLPCGCGQCAAPACPTGSHAVTCPPDTACTLDCSEYQLGADGCQLCACRTPATCAPPGAATCIDCRFGYRSGPGGCITCSCAEPPLGCAANASDAGA